MATNFIITEDGTSGLEFFETLVRFGIFKNTTVISSETGYTNVPATTKNCIDEVLVKIESGEIQDEVNIIVLFDTQFLTDYSAKRKYNEAKTALRAQKEYAKANSLSYKQPSYLCFESLMLSCDELPIICELGLQHKQSVLDAFKNLHEDVYSKQIMVGSKGKISVDIGKEFTEADYATSVGAYGAADTKTLERRFKVLLLDITWRDDRNILALCVPSHIKNKLGTCWMNQTICGTQYPCCKDCYLGNSLNKELSG